MKLGNVTHGVADVHEAVRFYGRALGLPVRFVDGDRYAALDAGGATLALAAPEEDLAGRAAASFKAEVVADALAAIVEAGGSVVREPAQGLHEVRAVAADPWGNVFVVYGPA